MRTSERLAAAAVAAMTAPAALVFPALGLSYVVKAWPAMSLPDRVTFSCALASFIAVVPICFRRGMRRIRQGHPASMTPLDSVLINIPILAGGWALTHQWGALLFMAAWDLWALFQAYKERLAATSRK